MRLFAWVSAALLVSTTAYGESLMTGKAPALKDLSDGRNVNYELGMKFISVKAGKISAIRYYQSKSESGSHTGKIYSAAGKVLATVTFANSAGEGWKEKALSAPLQISANTQYVVSVNTGKTYYVATNDGMASQISSANLRTVVGNNGVFGAVGKMPTQSWRNSNYFRDVVFTADAVTPPPQPPQPPQPPVEPPVPPVEPPVPPVEPPVPPVSSDYPSASNTGVPAGTQLTVFRGTYYVGTDNAVISNMDIIGNVVIQAKNVTLKNSRITSNTPYHLVYVIDGNSGFKMLNCELIGHGSTVNGVLGYGTFIGNKITGFDNGLNMWGGLVQDNYIHLKGGTAEAHFDGIEINGGVGIKIIHNTIIVEESNTATIMLNNEFGPLGDIEISNNRMVGAGYTLYLDPRKSTNSVDTASIKILNNRFGKGYWGYMSLYGSNPIRSGNVDDVTGKPID